MSYALEIEGLEKVYANGLQALKGIDLRVAQGDFFALLGPNGAGKSTTIGVICSLVNKTTGTVRVSGVDIDEDFPRAKRHLGVVSQEFNFNVFESVETSSSWAFFKASCCASRSTFNAAIASP